ncbi:hypothetical protein ACQW02_14100 [Humitalea sp. 24SJ18S-53]|uniref:hypothetical protein n=1 Tax=Humitalea sp. 24SJ18S-53 TaxID=3422307 RepID=UPI003D67ABC1
MLLGATDHAARAADLFSGTFTSDGSSTYASVRTAQDFTALLTTSGIERLLPAYTDVSAASISASFRGVPATLSFPSNSTTLQFVVPGAAVNESFTGATRDDSRDMLIEWLKGQGGSQLSQILQLAVATTGVDPVAGNPTSLMSMMGASDFNSATGIGGPVAATGSGRGSIGLGARFGSYTIGSNDTSVIVAPISYTHTFANGSALIVDVPLTLLDTNGAQSYSGSVGVGYRFPVPVPLPADWQWALTPALRFGGVGSIDMGAVGGLWSGSVTSALTAPLRDGTYLTLGNMISLLRTIPISYGGYNVSYELQNTMYRNGLILNQRLGEFRGREISASIFAIDTRFTGDALYVNNYQEYGVFLNAGEPMRLGGLTVPLRAGVTYLNGERGYSGFTVNLGVTF